MTKLRRRIGEEILRFGRCRGRSRLRWDDETRKVGGGVKLDRESMAKNMNGKQ